MLIRDGVPAGVLGGLTPWKAVRSLRAGGGGVGVTPAGSGVGFARGGELGMPPRIGIETERFCSGNFAALADAAALLLLPAAVALPTTCVAFGAAGVGVEALKCLLASRPRRISYISCSPPTLARDLGFLVSHGYVMKSVELFDFFPQTYHLESLARLTRNDLAES